MIENFKEATNEAFEGSVSVMGFCGLANGCVLGSFFLAYMIVTLFGSWLLYDSVRDDGCDPSGTADLNPTCDPSGTDVFGSLFGIEIAASVIPQISVAVESFIGARAAVYPALLVINRKIDDESNSTKHENKDDGVGKTEDVENQIVTYRGHAGLPKYEIDSSSEEGRKPSNVVGEIEFNDVRFSYPARPEEEVLRGFSLKIAAGKTGKFTDTRFVSLYYYRMTRTHRSLNNSYHIFPNSCLGWDVRKCKLTG